MTLRIGTFLSFGLIACLAATAAIVGHAAWPIVALATLVTLVPAFRDTWAYRSLLDGFYRLAAVVRRTVSAERVREHAWLNPA